MAKNKKSSKVGLISAIILLGEGVNKTLLQKCLESVSWCDDIIKVESKSRSFSDKRNEGLKLAKSDWILYVDIDEEITPSLKSEILSTINNFPLVAQAFAIPRRNIIFGQEFKYSGQYPDYQKRLFKRSTIKKWVGEIHEEPVFEGKLGHLKNPMIHHKDMTIADMIDKTNKWSEIEADLMIDAKHPPMNLVRFASAGFREFWKRFIMELCFLDGKNGIIYGTYQIYSKLISYSKLWEKQQSTIHI